MASQLTFTIQDESGDRSQVVIDVPSGEPLADYQTFANEAAVEIAAITAGQLLGASLRLELALAGAPFPVAEPGSDVEEKALFVFATAGGYRKRITIPAVDDSTTGETRVVLPSGQLDLSLDPGPGGFSTLMVAGSAALTPVDYRDDDITSLIEARKYFARDRGS